MYSFFLLALLSQSPDSIKRDPDLLNIPSSSSTSWADLNGASAQSLILQDKFSEAEQVVRHYLADHAQSADAHFQLGYILFKQRKAEPSLTEYTVGARYRTPSAYDLEVVACDYVLLGDYPDADKWFTKSIEFNPANPGALYYLGRAKYNENRFVEAVKSFEACLKLDPKNVKAEDNIGLSLEGLGRTEEATGAYETAIAWQQESPVKLPEPYLDLGTLLVEHNKPDEALKHLLEAARISPTDVRVHRQLGKAYFHLSKYEEARRELVSAVELAPQNAPTHFMLAQVYRKMGLPEKAQSESDRYKTLTGDHSVQ